MNFEDALEKENRAMSREFMVYGGVVGLILGIVGTLVAQGVFK